MSIATATEFRVFVEEVFTIGETGTGISERRFIDLYCDRFYAADEDRQRMKKSHEKMMALLLREFPTIRRQGKRLVNLSVKDNA